MLDLERIAKNLQDIKAEVKDIENTLGVLSSSNIIVIKALKYSLISICEAIANILQHILAKHYAISVSGYSECLEKAFEKKIISKGLYQRLVPFVRLRNMLVHRYWVIDDEIFLKNLKEGLKDFKQFEKEIKDWLRAKSYLK